MNMQAIMKQAQALQKDMLKTKSEIDEMTFEASSSLVTVKVNGKKEVVEVHIDDTHSLEKEDIEMLQDMIQIAMNEAMKKVDQITEEKMGKFGGSLPGMF